MTSRDGMPFSFDINQYTKEFKNMGKREHFALFLAGFGVGAATAILCAPTSGKTAAAAEGDNKVKRFRDTEKEGIKIMSDLKDKAKEKIDHVADAAKKATDKAADKAKDTAHKAGKKIEEGGKRLQDA